MKVFMTLMRRGIETELSGPHQRMSWIKKVLDVQHGMPHATGKGETCRHHECGVYKCKNIKQQKEFYTRHL